jgi:uncharacterized protein YajQ (UPF0234 family)
MDMLKDDPGNQETQVESKIRQIIREELAGIQASIENDPVKNAMHTIDSLDHALSSKDIDLNVVKEHVKNLKSLLPEISEEIEIIRDTLVGA